MTEETEAETSSDFSKVKQQVNGKAEIWTQVVWLHILFIGYTASLDKGHGEKYSTFIYWILFKESFIYPANHCRAPNVYREYANAEEPKGQGESSCPCETSSLIWEIAIRLKNSHQ